MHRLPGRGSSPEGNHAGVLILDFSASRTVCNKFLFIGHPVWILLWQPEETKAFMLEKPWGQEGEGAQREQIGEASKRLRSPKGPIEENCCACRQKPEHRVQNFKKGVAGEEMR